jgi:hypothetical protein
VSLRLRNASAGAVFVLLRGAAANAAGALDDAIAYDRSTADSLAEEDGFELAVPPRRERLWAATQASIAVSDLNL